MVRKATVALTLSLLVLTACGDDDGGVATTGATDGTGASSTSGGSTDPGDRGGTITIDGTTYVFVASVQCGIFDSRGQYYISGILPEVTDGELAYSRDESVHTLRVDLGDVNYSARTADDIESTISGRVVTGTATLTPDNLGDPVESEFRFEC